MYNKTLATTVVICAAIFLPRPASANPALLIPAAQEIVNLGAAALGMYGVWNRGQHKSRSSQNVYSSTTTTKNGTVEDVGQVSSQDECNKIAAARSGGKWRALPVEGQTPVNDSVTGKRINPVFSCKIMKYRN